MFKIAPAFYGIALFATGVQAGSWKNLRFAPDHISLANPAASQRFVVSATDESGREADVTRQCEIRAANPQVVTVDRADAVVRGKAPGRTELRIRLGSLRATAEIAVGEKQTEVTVPFSPSVISILTIKGCNSSGCHGSPAGQAGFKLSLFGYDPAADHEMIVRKNDGRRVNLDKPEESLVLRKPSFQMPHGGGRVLPEGSEEYRTLLEWLKQGAKLESSGARITRLEMYPDERVLSGKGAQQRFVVIGRMSDGTTRDMTREVRYSAGDEMVAAVSPDGMVTAGSRGLTPLLARGMGLVAASRVGVIAAPAAADFPKPAGGNFIDELVFAKLRALNVRPAALSGDSEFVRRVYLDTIGLLPAPEETREFLADSRPDKRSRLIDRLMERPEYASFWTVKFEDWFRNNQVNSQGRSMGRFKEWIRSAVSEDRPYDQFVREILTSEGDTFLTPATNFWHPAADFMLKKFDVNKVTPTVTRLFLGIRLECAECHNHPLENFTQDDFYGLSAFFARMKVKHGYGEYRRTWYLDDEGEVLHPVTKKPVTPKLLGGAPLRVPEGEDRRKLLADWVVSPQNPYFAQATVNRIWHEYFDAGIVEPFDDLRSTNPPTNRQLLDRLARYFADSGYRLKALHRLILNSQTYQLSSRGGGGEPEIRPLERLLFARYQPRRLPAEALLDSISQVTGVAHVFPNHPAGTRAMDTYQPDNPDYFLVAFGFPRRDVLADRSKSPALSQALHLMNGNTLLDKVGAKDNIIGRLLADGLKDEEIVASLYERAYSRTPSSSEMGNVMEYLAGEREAGRPRGRALEGVLWSVLNSKEFQLNH